MTIDQIVNGALVISVVIILLLQSASDLRILKTLNFIKSQNLKIMSDLLDLQALVQTLTNNSAAQKTALDDIGTKLTTIISGLPATGGLSEADVTTLKGNLQDAITASNAVTAEAQAAQAQVDAVGGAAVSN